MAPNAKLLPFFCVSLMVLIVFVAIGFAIFFLNVGYINQPSDFSRDENGLFEDFEPEEVAAVRGRITLVEHFGHYFVYELDGDGVFRDVDGTELKGMGEYADFAMNSRDDPDMTLISNSEIGEEDKVVLIKVQVKTDTATVFQWLEYEADYP